MSDINWTIKCKCGHNKGDHYKSEENPDLNYGSDKELNAGVCKNCDCKHFEEKKKD